uniref:phosphomannomutase n=1 Tax=Mimivirus LCMiAC02 TaxID=2506609 RepID=A0A4D5XEQ1_9VIRU|nr:MAG: phosphomannomutase [Mimivirus LCMiAC02]
MKLLLFDIDGTICESGEKIDDTMTKTLLNIKNKYTLGLVSGGEYNKVCNQISKLWDIFEYVFTENGLVSYKNKKLVSESDIRDKLGMNTITHINEVLMKYLSQTNKILIKTGSFINLRKGLIYFTPIGQNCTKQERLSFVEYDTKNNIRMEIIKDLSSLLPDLSFCIGGQIGISISPKGWDKCKALDLIKLNKYNEIIYIGDRIHPHGNDYSIAIDKRVSKYYNVTSLHNTLYILNSL